MNFFITAQGVNRTPTLSPASCLESIRCRKGRTPNDAVERILRASTREHGEQMDVARELIRVQQDKAGKIGRLLVIPWSAFAMRW